MFGGKLVFINPKSEFLISKQYLMLKYSKFKKQFNKNIWNIWIQNFGFV